MLQLSLHGSCGDRTVATVPAASVVKLQRYVASTSFKPPISCDDTVTKWHSSNGTHHVELVKIVSALSDQSTLLNSSQFNTYSVLRLIILSGISSSLFTSLSTT
jgi:hypothetical protein